MVLRPARRRFGSRDGPHGLVRVSLRSRTEHAAWDRLVAGGDGAAVRQWAEGLGERRGGSAGAEARWHAGAESEGQPEALIPWAGPPPPGAVVWVASLPRHRGLVPYVSGELADVSLCLSQIRLKAAAGDLLLIVSAAKARSPRVYAAAARPLAAAGDAAVVAVLRISAVVPLRLYCRLFGTMTWRGGPAQRRARLGASRPRASAMYREVAPSVPGARLAYDGLHYVARSRARWHAATDSGPRAEQDARQDLSGPTLLASSWRTWRADLADAPRAAPAFRAWLLLRRRCMRGGVRASAQVPGDAAVFAFVESLAA
jgi:hypothetical protein